MLVANLIKWLRSLPQWGIIFIGLLLVSLISAIDYIILIDISLSIFYLIPIIMVTWFTRVPMGILFSIVCAVLWLVGDIFAKNYPYPWIPYWNAAVRLGFFLTITYLLWELKKAYQRERWLARTDGLTGITNRRFFLELLEVEAQRFRRHQRPFTLAYLDVDNFKAVNDSLGHSMGDKLLCLISDTITANIRSVDIVARLGGDEFALLLPETDYEAAQLVLNRLQEKLNAASALDSFPVGFSIGAVTFLALPESIDQMIELVDRLMYDVKSSGQNRLKHEVFSGVS